MGKDVSDDASLVARIRAGDQAAYESLFLTYFPRLVDFAMTLVASRAVAEELVADVFLSLWRRRTQWEPSGPVNGYLYRAVRNQAMNTRRATARERARYETVAAETDESPGMGESQPPIDTRLEGDELRAAVGHALGTLSPERRQIALLRWREGMPVAEIAAITGTSRAAVQMQLTRIVGALRRMLPDDFR